MKVVIAAATDMQMPQRPVMPLNMESAAEVTTMVGNAVLQIHQLPLRDKCHRVRTIIPRIKNASRSFPTARCDSARSGPVVPTLGFPSSRLLALR